MNRMTTRIARITASSILVVGLGALGAGPALATGSTWPGSAPPSTTSDGGAGTDGFSKPGGVHAVEDGARTDILIASGIDTQKVRAAEDAGTETYNSWAG